MSTVQGNEMCVLCFLETKFVIKLQRRYGTQYGKCPSSHNVIRRWLKQFKGNDSVVTAIETITQQMLVNIWKEIKYRLDIIRAMKGAYVEVV
jgi:hypothetical protein